MEELNQIDERQLQRHVHEVLGSTAYAEVGQERHNHRFAGVSGQAIPIAGGNHVHEAIVNVDFFDNHFHEIHVRTGPAIQVSPNKHVHFANGMTTLNDGHRHQFIFASLIQNPTQIGRP